MELARQVVLSNLFRHAKPARQRMALSLEDFSRLADVPVAELEALESGDSNVHLGLDELVALALCLGLTARGEVRSKPIAGSLP